MKTKVILFHTILGYDLDKIDEQGYIPRVNEQHMTIICGTSHYFYFDNQRKEMNEDYEKLTKYLKKK